MSMSSLKSLCSSVLSTNEQTGYIEHSSCFVFLLWTSFLYWWLFWIWLWSTFDSAYGCCVVDSIGSDYSALDSTVFEWLVWSCNVHVTPPTHNWKSLWWLQTTLALISVSWLKLVSGNRSRLLPGNWSILHLYPYLYLRSHTDSDAMQTYGSKSAGLPEHTYHSCHLLWMHSRMAMTVFW